MNVPGEFKFRHVKVSSILKKCEVTNDVRYQECTEITLDFERQNKVKGYFFLSWYRPKGRIFVLQGNYGAGMQIIQPVTQCILQHSILLLAGTMTGEVPGREGVQLPDSILKFPSGRIHPDEMEAAEEYIRLKPAENIQHALVGAAAENYLFAIFLQKQILLMQIWVIRVNSVFPDRLSKDTEGEGAHQIIAGTQGDTVSRLQHI